MESTNPFAQMPATPEPIIAQVRSQLADDHQLGARVPPEVLDRLADQAVRELWDRPIKTFVPLLALRHAREILLTQDWLVRTQHEVIGDVKAPTTSSRDERRALDDLSLQDDVMPHANTDVLGL